MKNVIVIGGGAAGMMAAIQAAKNGHSVQLLEKNEKLGKKIYITGKGRCNITNGCDTQDLFKQVVRNSKFLYSAFYTFSNHQVIDFFESNGLATKTERGERIFPVTDHASDVIAVLQHTLQKEKAEIRLHTQVTRILEANHQVIGVELSDKSRLKADAVIVATGGCSYITTGSTGDGYRFAQNAGHLVTDLRPSLVPFETQEAWAKELQGLSLKNVSVRISKPTEKSNQGQLGKKEKVLFEEFGEMLFTHYGISGPLILSASSIINDYLVSPPKKQAADGVVSPPKKQAADGVVSPPKKQAADGVVSPPLSITIDLKPALSKEQLDKRILREFEESQNRQFRNAVPKLFPARLVPVMIALSGISPEKKVNEITREERLSFVDLIKALPLTLSGTRDFNEAIITRGGVKVSQVNPSTMESKLVKGMYFAGEVLDADALTGGFNLQIAWSTGYLAGDSISLE